MTATVPDDDLAPPGTAAGYGPALGWLALAGLGQIVTVRLIDAGPILHYQHFPPLGTLPGTHAWSLLFLALQLALVSLGLLRARLTIGSRQDRVRLLMALGLISLTAATVSPSPARFAGELAFAAALQLMALGTLVLAATSLPPSAVARAGTWLARVFGPDGEPAPLPWTGDRFVWILAAFTTLVSAALSYWSYERHPHVPDELIYVLHARYFANGLLSMPAPPVPAAFDFDLMTYRPTLWYSPMPLGWPAALAVGTWLGAHWLVNPVLAGVNIVLASSVFSHLYSRRVARYATVLLAMSPWHLFLGMSLMTHILTLCCVLLAALGVLRSRATGSWGWALVAGAGVGLTSLIRPLDGVLVGLLIAAWSFGVGGKRLTLGAIVALGISTAAVGAMALPYNAALTGDPLNFPVNQYFDEHYGKGSNSLGFGPDRGVGWGIDPNPGHSPFDAVVNANLNLFGINIDLFGWSTGSLVLVAFFLCFGRLARADYLMLATIATFIAALSLYYFSGGPDFAARYWFPVILPFVALSARGLSLLEQRFGARVPIAVAALICFGMVIYVPWRAVDKYHGFRGMRPGPRALASQYGFANDLVLVRGNRFPDYASAATENPIDLRSPSHTIYAWDRGADVRAQVLATYPDRRVWIVEGPSITGNGYRVVAGPLTAAAAATADQAQ